MPRREADADDEVDEELEDGSEEDGDFNPAGDDDEEEEEQGRKASKGRGKRGRASAFVDDAAEEDDEVRLVRGVGRVVTLAFRIIHMGSFLCLIRVERDV